MAGDDDSLALLFLACHPSLTPPSAIALTLRAVGGLTTAEIAGAFLVTEATMAQRISRAKATIRRAGARFETPTPEDGSSGCRACCACCTWSSTRGTPARRATTVSAWSSPARRSG